MRFSRRNFGETATTAPSQRPKLSLIRETKSIKRGVIVSGGE